MNASSKVAAGIVAFVAVGVAIGWYTMNASQREFEHNERVIALANARQEAALTPEQRAARAKALKDAAIASAAANERERLASLLPAARGACLIALKRSLHDPGSAEFGLTSEWPSRIGPDGRATVVPRVRAKNAFGALRLTEFHCVVERSGSDAVRVVSLRQLPD